ncbi:terminase large subunit [Halomonas sp. H33-56]|uniref:terminase large subunit domain-containing protein n=1 Tax=Halomonas sp. H33-56 TaxID=2950873 RepID=UPI0032DF5162
MPATPIETEATLNRPQGQFLAMQQKFRAYVAGFGSGKTWVGCSGIGAHAWQHPRINMGYFAPTYPQIRDIFYPTIEEVAHSLALRAEVREANREVHLYSGRQYRATVICRSMDKPGSIVGFKIGHALVDELDLMATAKAEMAWRKIMARMRYKVDGLKNGIDVTTTPEGFKFVHQQFVKALRDKPSMAQRYGLVQASTYDNEANLPDDYIDALLEAYPPQLIDAYLRGLFVNLTTGTVYRQFDRALNACMDTVQQGEPLFIGMDFNVGKMAAVTHVKRDGDPRAVDEIMGGHDTPDMIRRIKERYWRYDGDDYIKTCEIHVYPDASGDSRRSVNASTTDIAQLRDAGFRVVVNASNPPVKDRVNSMNAAFCNAKGERRYKVNPYACPAYTDALEQQAWNKQGEPDKENDKDHPNDAAGYFIVKDYLVNKPKVGMKRIRGLA